VKRKQNTQTHEVKKKANGSAFQSKEKEGNKPLELHFRLRVFREKLRLEGLQVRKRLRIPRLTELSQLHFAQARASFEQQVERQGVDLQRQIPAEVKALE